MLIVSSLAGDEADQTVLPASSAEQGVGWRGSEINSTVGNDTLMIGYGY